MAGETGREVQGLANGCVRRERIRRWYFTNYDDARVWAKRIGEDRAKVGTFKPGEYYVEVADV